MITIDKKRLLSIKMEELYVEELIRQIHNKVTETTTNQIVLTGLEIVSNSLPATFGLNIDKLEKLTESFIKHYEFFKEEEFYTLEFGGNILEYVEFITQKNHDVATVFKESYLTVKKLVKQEEKNYGK